MIGTVRLQSLNRYTDEQGVNDVDEEDSADEQLMEKSSIFGVENATFESKKNYIPKKWFPSIKKKIVSDAGRLMTVDSWQFYPSCRSAGSRDNSVNQASDRAR